jgi:hypothetical protein
MKKFFKWLICLGLIVWALCYVLTLFAGPKAKTITYGATFSYPYAENLGLNWKEAYTAMLEDLNLKLVRIPAYWNLTESKQGEYNFENLDFQLDEAKKHGAKVLLAVGRRLPRWPECHEPGWLKELSIPAQENAQLSYVETVVNRYASHPAVSGWQVENEPFLAGFGECPKPDSVMLDKEIQLVKSIDPMRPILISDSGELSMWISSGQRGDMFGTTLYRFVFSDVFKRYWVNYIPYWFYRVKAGLLRLLNPGKPVMIVELQAEPWTTKGILQTPIEEQFMTMSLKKFDTMISVAHSTGFSPQYLWGAEWWYWMKQNQHPEFWERAKELNQ